jgi:hypothetical protein
MTINNNKEDWKQKSCRLSQIKSVAKVHYLRCVEKMRSPNQGQQADEESLWLEQKGPLATTLQVLQRCKFYNFASSNDFNLAECQNVTLSCNQNACQKKGERMDPISNTPITRPTRYLILAPWGMNGGWTRETFPSSSSSLSNFSRLVSSDFCFNYPLTNNLVALHYVPTTYLPSSNLLSYLQDRLRREVEYQLSLGSSIPEQCF